MNEPLNIQVAYQIQKPISKVFEAIVDPDKMSQYFIDNGSGRMEAGQTVFWTFPEFPSKEAVQVLKVEKNNLVVFSWKIDGQDHTVEISLESVGAADTLVRIKEGSRQMDSAGIRWLKGNTEGWMNFLCCLKAYLEYGINLRKGGYDFLVEK